MSILTVNLEGLRLNTSTLLGLRSLSDFVCVGGKLKQHLSTIGYWLRIELLVLSFIYV